MRKRLTALLLLTFLMILPVCSCGSSDSDAANADEPVTGWEYFETFNPIGSTYETIQNNHKSLEEEGNYDGGIILKVDGNDKLYFGFPRYSMSMIEPGDQCTSVYGDLETVFGKTFKELYSAWAAWNEEQCVQAGIIVPDLFALAEQAQ